jgi:hypothetical protein
VKAGRVSSAALMLSGVAAVVNPQGVADALHLTTADARGVTETRAGLGGTYAALGGWALVSREPAADAAVGMTWLGAAAVRVATWRVDRPPASASYWAYLGLEVACGTVSLVSAVTRRRAARGLWGGVRRGRLWGGAARGRWGEAAWGEAAWGEAARRGSARLAAVTSCTSRSFQKSASGPPGR